MFLALKRTGKWVPAQEVWHFLGTHEPRGARETHNRVFTLKNFKKKKKRKGKKKKWRFDDSFHSHSFTVLKFSHEM